MGLQDCGEVTLIHKNGVAIVKGVGAQYDSETLRKPVIAFVIGEKGLIADVSLEGAKVTKLPQ